MITSDILQNRIKNFWGYGKLDASTWFIGMEERIDKFDFAQEDKEGESILEKQFIYAEKVQDENGMINVDRTNENEWGYLANMSPFLHDQKTIQPTWRYPIALYLYLESEITKILNNEETKKAVLKHQVDILSDGVKKKTATLELSSLPNPSIKAKDWLPLYTREGFLSREDYLPKRAKELKKLIQEHQPQRVIFYGLQYKSFWEVAIGAELKMETPRMYFIKSKHTLFYLIPQGRGMSFGGRGCYERLYEFAKKIKDQISTF